MLVVLLLETAGTMVVKPPVVGGCVLPWPAGLRQVELAASLWPAPPVTLQPDATPHTNPLPRKPFSSPRPFRSASPSPLAKPDPPTSLLSAATLFPVHPPLRRAPPSASTQLVSACSRACVRVG